MSLDFSGGSVSKESPAMQLTQVQSLGSIPGLGRSSGEGNGNLLQYSCLENSMDKGAWWTIQSRGSQRIRHNWMTNTSCWISVQLSHSVVKPDSLTWNLALTILFKSSLRLVFVEGEGEERQGETEWEVELWYIPNKASTDPRKNFGVEMPFRATPCWDELARPLINY